jgi:hypothetical protein
MLYSEIIAVCSEIHINTLCGQNVELLGAFAKLQKAAISFPMSLRYPHGIARLPQERFSLNVIFEFFSPENLPRQFRVR